MRLLTAEVSNFGSYKHLEFDFTNQGLTLIYGATGSGKSTLQDIPSWILFGITAKNGNVDDIRAWNSEEEPTTGLLSVEIRDSRIAITRIRGKASQNDLYWTEAGSEPKRGKDINETQKLLENRLNVDKDLYIIAAYYNEFSPTSTFFTSKAKDKRELFEKIAVLDLPIHLEEKAATIKKETKKTLSDVQKEYARDVGRIEELRRINRDLLTRADAWDDKHRSLLEELVLKETTFHTEKASKLAALETKKEVFELERQKNIDKLLVKLEKVKHLDCPECGQPNKDANENLKKLTSLSESPNPYLSQIETTTELLNPYKEQLQAKNLETNPFRHQLFNFTSDAKLIEASIKAHCFNIDNLEHKIFSLSQLQDLSLELRGQILKNSIKQIESKTNEYLETHFDSEIRVEFQISGSDELDVNIWKSGHSCSYRQLSKGQKTLLKLCFSVSIMVAAATKSGTHFSNLFLDEALDGLDTDFKVKAFGLFQSLEIDHESIFVVDHALELQNLFFNKYLVTIESDLSTINKES